MDPSKYPCSFKERCILSGPPKKKAIYILREDVSCFNARDLALDQHKRTKSPWTIKFWSLH